MEKPKGPPPNPLPPTEIIKTDTPNPQPRP